MKNMLFRAIAIIAVVAMCVTANAQVKGEKAAGAGLVFGSGNGYSNTGIGAKFRYNVTDPIRLEGSFSYFFEKTYMSMWDLGVNGHYLFSVADQVTVYPLVGLSILGVTYEYTDGDTEFGFGLGGGVDYQLNDQLALNAELKYRLGDWDRMLISLGVAYKF